MHRFFLEQDLKTYDEISLNKDLSHQILKVLRMNKGDKFEIFNNTGRVFLSEISSKEDKLINCKIIKGITPLYICTVLTIAGATPRR